MNERERAQTSLKAKPQRAWWRRHGLEIAVIAALFFGIQAYNSRGAARGPAPQLADYRLNGEMTTLVPSDESVMVHFWASWCGICGFMDGSVDRMADDHKVITVALRSGSVSAVSNHLKESGLDFPVINDEMGIHAARWGIRGVPTTFFIDANGHIDHVTVGFSSWLGLRFRMWLASLS